MRMKHVQRSPQSAISLLAFGPLTCLRVNRNVAPAILARLAGVVAIG